MKRTILITGGTGYIGSHAVIAFERAGYTIVLVDNFSNSSKIALKGIGEILGYTPDFFEGNIGDSIFIDSIFSRYNFDGVIHFAGLKAVGESCENPLLYFDNNISGSIILFKAMEKYGVKNLIFSSSATVYREHSSKNLTEDMPLGSGSPYATTKLVIEHLLHDLVVFKKWSISILRYFNPIGADPSGSIGEIPNGIPNNLLPYIFEVALGKRPFVHIYGNDYVTHDGTGIRDYIDVCDLVESHILAYTQLSSDLEIINIGTGNGTSVREMIALVEKVSKRTIPYKISPRRSGDLTILCCSPKKAYAHLGWKAVTPIEVSIANSWKYVLSVSENETMKR